MPLLKRLNDQEMTDALRRGDKDALTQLYKDNHNSVRSYILRNNGTEDDAEDILQDACIAVWEKCRNGSIELKARLSTLVFAISKNLWLKRLGRLSRQVQLDGVNTEKMSVSREDIPAHDRHLVLHLLETLGEKCRDILSLFYFDGLDMNSIAEQLNYNNADTAKAKKHQCFKQLQEQFLKSYRKNDFLGH